MQSCLDAGQTPVVAHTQRPKDASSPLKLHLHSAIWALQESSKPADASCERSEMPLRQLWVQATCRAVHECAESADRRRADQTGCLRPLECS